MEILHLTDGPVCLTIQAPLTVKYFFHETNNKMMQSVPFEKSPWDYTQAAQGPKTLNWSRR